MGEMYHFIVNVHSRTGKAQAIWKDLEQYLMQQQVPYKAYITEYAGHATELAQKICALPGEVILVTVGGDGTANEVLSGMYDFDRVKFGYIPTGSGNDLARGLGIKKEPLEILKGILKSKQTIAMDVGQITYEGNKTRRFAISSGLGIDADVCKQALTSKLKKFLNHIHAGHLTYAILTVKTLFTMKLSEGTLETAEGETYEAKKIIFIAAMNHIWEGGGVPMAPRASAFDGQLSLCYVHDIPRIRCLFLFPKLLAGKHEGLRGFDLIDTRECHIRLREPMIVHADGEYCGEQTDITFTCLPKLCRIICS